MDAGSVAQMTTSSHGTVRHFKPTDRAIIRKICCDTGFLGNPVDPLFEDRELFADYLTRYYTDFEPDSAMVYEENGVVKGYIIGSRFQRSQAVFDLWHNLWLAVRGGWRYFTRYDEASKKFVRWVLTEARKQVPFTPPNMAHFHINLLPEARGLVVSRAIIETYIRYLASVGEEGVFGQMVVYEKRRGELFFARYGFRVVDVKEVTKYRDLTDEKVFLFTVVKDLRKTGSLYGEDFREEVKKEKAHKKEAHEV